MKNKDIKTRIPIKTYLFCLVLITMIATSITFSRYINVVLGEDSINMASYVVEMELSKDSTAITIELDEIVPGNEHDYDLEVTNSDGTKTSDISFRFNVSIFTDNILPLHITLLENWVDGGSFTDTDEDGMVGSDSYNVGQGTVQQVDFIVRIKWDETINDYIHADKTDTVTIIVAWEQIT